jgi:hypothetical protein
MPSDVPSQQVRTAVTERIIAHVAQGWPHLGEPVVRHRGKFCYVGTVLPGSEEPTPILRLRYQGSADRWAIAIYMASKERYIESELPSHAGAATGTPEEGIDHTFILYAGPSAIVSPAQTPEDDQDAAGPSVIVSPAEAPKDDQDYASPNGIASPAETPEDSQDYADPNDITSPAQDPEAGQDVESAEDTTASSPDQISAVREPQRRTFPWLRIPIPRLKLWRTG